MEKFVETKIDVEFPAFEYGSRIPVKYTCDGEDVYPPLRIGSLPESAESLAIIMEDPDAPNGTFDHWVVWNLEASEGDISESVPSGVEGVNSFGTYGYGGPCPPEGEHRYFFRVLALDAMLDLNHDANKNTLLEAMEGHIVAEGEWMGTYARGK